jgi:hypothetical protein
MRRADAPSAPSSAALTVLHLSRTHRRYPLSSLSGGAVGLSPRLALSV